MGLMQRALETYDALAPKYAGVYIEGQVPLAPVAHITKRMNIEISIGLDGSFHSAKKTDEVVIIPSTDMAEKRTSTAIAPYPLSENIGYLYEKNNEKYQKYVRQLQAWSDYDASNQVLKAILTYVQSGNIVQDLYKCGLIKLDEDMNPKKDEKITWRVIGCDPERTSRNIGLFNSFIRFYEETHSLESGESLADREKDVCMIIGRQLPVSIGYGKSIVPSYGNAKLVSSNDKDGYTYRGRFVDAEQALSVSYEAVQKVQNVLRWLIANQGVPMGKRTFLCWNPEGVQLPKDDPDTRDDPDTLFGFHSEPSITLSDYQSNLEKALKGYRRNITDDNKAVIMCFDGTSDKAGRLSIVYYNELQASDFLDRLYDWNESCCWLNGRFGIQSPSLYKIISYAFGSPRKETINGKEMVEFICDDKVTAQQVQRLIVCRLEKAPIPIDIVRALIIRCSNLQLYAHMTLKDSKKGDSIEVIEDLLFTACAVIRKFRMGKPKKEEWELALEPHRKDISYQYGRLLAVMEKAERDTYEPDEKREPNAIRYQPMFILHPLKEADNIMIQVKNAYYPHLEPAERITYEKLIQEIMYEISECKENWNSPLKDTYLMGYYLQKRELYQPKERKQKEETK